jgi:hypothetical protein
MNMNQLHALNLSFIIFPAFAILVICTIVVWRRRSIAGMIGFGVFFILCGVSTYFASGFDAGFRLFAPPPLIALGVAVGIAGIRQWQISRPI